MTNREDRLREAIKTGRSENLPLPTLEELDQIHIEGLIEEIGFIREDLGMYRRLLKKPDLWPENKARLKTLKKLREDRLNDIRTELEELNREQEADQREAERLPGAGQRSFVF
jgi:hypothetical protein